MLNAQLSRMLAAQSSLVESVDGEELRSDEERRGERPTPTITVSISTAPEDPPDYYYFYVYCPGRPPQHAADSSDEGSLGGTSVDPSAGEDFSLSLVDTNLPGEAEPELRSFIAKRLSRGAMFEGMGNVASVDLSSPEYSLGCYYSLIHPEMSGHPGSQEYVVCFLGGSEKGLDLLELDQYVAELRMKLEPQMGNLDSVIRPLLQAWYEVSVVPIHRVVTLFQEKLAHLLHAALSYTTVEVSNCDQRTKDDISRFLSSASLQGLVQEGTMTSLCIAMTERHHHTLTVDFRGGQPELLNAVSNRFCEDWMRVFINSYDGGNPFLFRQKLENFKLKAIQDMNNLKRLIRQAESSHYALFRCYNFLKNCGNGDILLQIVKVEHAEMPEASSVVKVLEEFIHEEGFSVREP